MAQAGGGSGQNGGGDDVSSVYFAVRAGETAARVGWIIEQYASAGGAHASSSREYLKRCWAAANYMSSANENETPLEAAHERLRRGDLVGVLLEAGADAKVFGPRCNALALAIHHDQIETLRALLRSGRHKEDETLRYVGVSGHNPVYTIAESEAVDFFCSPVHVAAIRPRIDALEVLVREFGADANAREWHGLTPLRWAVYAAPPSHDEQMVDALVSLGADLESLDDEGRTPIYEALKQGASLAPRLLSLGASADVVNDRQMTPLMHACVVALEAAPALLRASSRETRRAVEKHGDSAIDLLVEFFEPELTEELCQDVVRELLSAGAPVKPCYASIVLPIAARQGVRLERRVAARPHDPPPWQMHEAIVKLAFDFQDVRAVEEGVQVRERRVRELEEALRAPGEGTEDSGDSDEEGGESGSGGAAGGSSS